MESSDIERSITKEIDPDNELKLEIEKTDPNKERKLETGKADPNNELKLEIGKTDSNNERKLETGPDSECRLEKGCTYIVLRIEYTTNIDANMSLQYEVTYVPWYTKDGKKTYLEDKGIMCGPNYDNEMTAVATIIKFTRYMLKYMDPEYSDTLSDDLCEEYINSIMNIQNSHIEDEYGQYLQHNWHNYESKAEKCCEDWERSYMQSAYCKLYRLAL